MIIGRRQGLHRDGWIVVRVVTCVALVTLANCAPLPAPPSGAAVPPSSGTPAPATAPVRSEPAHTNAPRDSTPSAEAERVLATIPEPLSPSQQVPPPARAPGMVTTAAPAAAYDTLRVERSAENDASAVPVPSATQPLGTEPGGTLTVAGAIAATPSTAPPAAAAMPSTAPAAVAPATTQPASGECWRLQVAAPEEKAKAESRSAAAQSLLLVAMGVTYEKGLYKVRTHDCMSRETAEALKQRALDSGFDGSFLLNTAAAPASTAAKPKSSSAPAKKHTPTATKKQPTP